MVFVNDKKFACESCIKGHRSSACSHTDRPLFEIKKKGRPVSQCERCRELRKTKRVHSKCICVAEKLDKSDFKPLSTNSKRYIPIQPTLPNGLKDVFQSRPSTSRIPPDPRAQVNTLLNPCPCKDVWSCKCRSNALVMEDRNGATSFAGCGLDALANAAAMCCQTECTDGPDLAMPKPSKGKQKVARGCCAPSRSPSPPSKRPRRRSASKASSKVPSEDLQRGPALPPLFSIPPNSPTSTYPFQGFPNFPVIPPLSTVASLAGTGCTCGFDCTCPGCVEHRGEEHACKDHEDCPDGCTTCVDHQLGGELPQSTPFGTITPTSPGSSVSESTFIDAFFARAAAAIPPPPSQRASTITLDPTNITVYPAGLFDKARLDDCRAAFGLIRLPKLECCAGRCGCPGDICGCGKDCDGCCAEHEKADTHVDASEPVNSTTPTPPASVESSVPARSCCSS